MTWVRLEDTAPLHPKMLRLSDGAFRLWVHFLAFANRAVTDGVVEKALVSSLNHHGIWSKSQLKKFLEELEKSGLLVDLGDRYAIHDYAHHQAEAMKERVERKREFDRARQRAKRERENAKAAESLVMSRRDTDRDSRRETSVPSRPDLNSPPPPSAVTQPEVVVDDGPPERLDILPGTTRFDGLTVGYIVDRFGRYMAQETGSIPLSLAGNTDRTKRLARGVLEWAKQHDPEDPKGIVRASAFAFAKRYAAGKGEINGTRVRDPLALWASNPGVWMEEAS